MKTIYRGYEITKNDYNYGNVKQCAFQFCDLNDCDMPYEYGFSINDCMEQIDLLIDND
jgi:hypothetical protein